MSRLRVSGLVERGDDARCDDEETPGGILIGGRDWLAELLDDDFTSAVRVLVNGEEVCRGDVVGELGWGYSEYTPMEWDTLTVSGFDLMVHLHSYVGQTIELLIEDIA